MDRVEQEAPLYTIEIDPAELAKCTPDELRLPLFRDFYDFEQAGYIARQGRPELEWAAVDLAKYESFDDYIAGCRKVHKGNAVRDAIKAEKLGYYAKFFDYASYIPDIVAINTSTPERGGHPMTPLYTLSVEQSGGYPARIAHEAIPSQAASWVRRFGLFRRRDGHRQGETVCNEQLLAYMSLRRHGNFANYGAFIGHAEHLPEGIMYRLHFELVRLLINARDAVRGADPSLDCLKGIRFIGYTNFYLNRAGMVMWKRRGLFEPIYLQLDYLAPDWVEPLCRAAADAPENADWQRECAEKLAVAAQRCIDAGRLEEAARAQAELAAVSQRLKSHSDEAA